MPPASRSLHALTFIVVSAACARPEEPPTTSEAQAPLAANPADQKSLWATEEGRVVYYFIDRDRIVSTLSPAQSSCQDATPGRPFTHATVDAIHATMQRFDDQTPLTFVELRSLPLTSHGTIEDPGYDVLVITGWDEDGAFHGAPSPPEGEVLSCITLPPAATVATVPVRKVQHEVLHNLGMQHEQDRSHRDEAIVASDLPCARVAPILDESRNLTPYDKTSIMQYGSERHDLCPEWDYL